MRQVASLDAPYGEPRHRTHANARFRGIPRPGGNSMTRWTVHSWCCTAGPGQHSQGRNRRSI